MAKRSADLKKIFAPSDAGAFFVIALGLFIALFLDEMAVRLIGVCIAILGGVALFMMVSPRLAELSMQGRPPRPSDSPLLTSETRRDSQSKRRVFEREAFVEEYGVAEPEDEDFKDDDQIALFPDGRPDSAGSVKAIREYRRTVPLDTPIADRSNEPRGDRGNDPRGDRGNDPRGDRGNEPRGDRGNDPRGDRGNDPRGDRGNERGNDRSNERRYEQTEAESMLGKTFGDGDESSAVRVVGVKKKGSSTTARAEGSKPEGLQIHNRERQRAEELRARIERERTQSQHSEEESVSAPFAKRTPSPAQQPAQAPTQPPATTAPVHYTPGPSAPKSVPSSFAPDAPTTIDTPDGDTIVIRPRAPRAPEPTIELVEDHSQSVAASASADEVAPTPHVEPPARDEELPTRYEELPTRYEEFPTRYEELPTRYDEPAMHHDVSGTRPDASTTRHEEPTTFIETASASVEEPMVATDGPSLADTGVALPQQPRETRRRKPDVSLNEFIDEDHQVPGGQHEPRKEFDQLLNRVLMVIRSATNARTAAFFWVNAEKQQLVVEARITEATDAFVEARKIPLGRDAVSQIAIEGRPEILTEISAAAELDLLPYYSSPAGTVSFIGVPVYYGGKVVGVLCADSLVEDAYSDITVGFFGQFTKLISGLVQSYTGKFDLLQSSLTLNALQQFRTFVGGSPSSIEHLLKALLNATITCLDVRTIGAVLFDAYSNAWTIQDLRSQLEDFGIALGDSVDLATSVTGAAIMQGETVVINGPSNEICLRPSELPLDEGQFVAIPLRSTTMTYGALFFDNHLGTLTQQDISIAETLGEQAGTLIEQFRTSEMMQGGVLLDYATGSMNRTGFDMRMREEFARAVDYQVPLTVCLVRIDTSRALSDLSNEQSQHILSHVLNLVKAQLRDYDVIAHLGENLLAIGLIGYNSQQAQMWTENIRGKIASSIIEVDGRRFSVTVSIGVAEATPRDSSETLFANALQVLGRSEKLTNKVTVFA